MQLYSNGLHHYPRSPSSSSALTFRSLVQVSNCHQSIRLPCSGTTLDSTQLTAQRRPRISSTSHINMEASSPLAAMQPSSFMHGWGRSEMFTSHPHAHLAAPRFGPGAFNFRDLSMKRPSQPDYFTMKPVRGSSPTASLAADLSQNFHIDMRYAGFNSQIGTSLTFTVLNCQLPDGLSSHRTSSEQLMVGVCMAHWQMMDKMLTIYRMCYDSSSSFLLAGTHERANGHFSSSTQAAILLSDGD